MDFNIPPHLATQQPTESPPEQAQLQQTVIVTGAAGGIGRECVRLLRQNDHTVIGWDLPEVDITSSNPTDPRSVESHLSKALAAHGHIDALIHCAGTLIPDSALTGPTAVDTVDTVSGIGTDPNETGAWENNFAVNVTGLARTCSAIAQHMVDRGTGAIVAVTSNAAAQPRARMASYGASKAAATAWLKTLALECAPHGVRCNSVSPGSTDTAMLRTSWHGEDRAAQTLAGVPEDYRLGIPLQRIAQPEDIAAACLFLISPAACHITMHDLRVDGGATLDA
ncbi:2,3-dihydro-2,3-dihydroxybenzoate dehydrogenase [Corynebacterium jeikeium]|jgi:2,3-dihydro-2,3-dihydroxybenzoate dehydrogenase|uniref:2,3-dihydro-2,3-dihydroxybenzoate dehydrogenase n=1 Tax=Corynebacterium jeikeium TaxID=38289 RepID=UPI00068BF866|nr:2,3-dihydro-2,3-dihydroxybenzoate dehydrogenase [Corynebacterium jeikeium]